MRKAGTYCVLFCAWSAVVRCGFLPVSLEGAAHATDLHSRKQVAHRESVDNQAEALLAWALGSIQK